MRKLIRILIAAVLLLVLLSCGAGALLYGSAMRSFRRSAAALPTAECPDAVQLSDSVRVCGDNSLVLNPYGLWEGRISGSAAMRGALLGQLAGRLIRHQEEVFVGQIHRIIPSERYVRFLHRLIIIFNRRMTDHIPVEFLTEINAMSAACSHDYDAYGDPYVRQLNYHAAHDIGHAMQEYMLVGCSSFAVRDGVSADGGLLIGRNFDFYVGDDFAETKILLCVEPDSGYRYASVTWPGMTGVVSGMNERGLTVTINAAKGAVPTSSAMPVSLLAREILQYAATIGEALAIAEARQTFVSESLLIGSAAEHRAAVIEKTPRRTALYAPDAPHLVCTNHYQSEALRDDPDNVANIASSESKYRFDRLEELIARHGPLTPDGAAALLRDRAGAGDVPLGLTNEMAINQCIAHHAVIFQPERLRMWVSTAPWQCGTMLCYDLHDLFAHEGAATASLADAGVAIAADSAFLTAEYPRVAEYRRLAAAIRQAIADGEPVAEETMAACIAVNPDYFGAYDLAGDRAWQCGDRQRAAACWRMALSKEIPHADERKKIEKKLGKI